MHPEIPDRVYFKIGEVAEIVGVETHVLRFWESEFSQIRPSRTTSRQRMYRRKDVVIFLEIKRLLYDEQYTIPGARKHLASKPGGETSEREGRDESTRPENDELIIRIKAGLTEIKKILDGS